MKKVLLVFFLITLPLFVFTTIASAATGDQCRKGGGQCKTTCTRGSEYDDGVWDCPQGGIVGGSTCCRPAVNGTPIPPRQLSCGDPCSNASQCPSDCPACQELIQGQGKVCRTPGAVTPAPGSCPSPTQLSTAIGCIDTSNPTNFITNILGLAVGIGGGIAFLLMLFGTFQIMASSGDPKSIQAGKETITSALTGLLLIIFSVFLLRLIGVDILGIPGLNKPGT